MIFFVYIFFFFFNLKFWLIEFSTFQQQKKVQKCKKGKNIGKYSDEL